MKKPKLISKNYRFPVKFFERLQRVSEVSGYSMTAILLSGANETMNRIEETGTLINLININRKGK